MGVNLHNDIAVLLAKRFIQRRDLKAQQEPSGAYHPVYSPWRMSDIHAHLDKQVSYGHYLLDQESKCRFFAFDIDLEKEGSWCEFPDLSNRDLADDEPTMVVHPLAKTDTDDEPLRNAWKNRAHPGRPWFKYQLRMAASKLAQTVTDVLELPVAVAYSGNKGLHVYGFTGPVAADEAREAAELVLAATGAWEPARGKNFYRAVNLDPIEGFPNLSIEVFPKQAHLENGGLGNLLRLPLGKNLKSKDPTFFVDMNAPMSVIAPHKNPVAVLESGNPWRE